MGSQLPDQTARPQGAPPDSTVAFLLAELSLLDEEFRRLRSEGGARTNAYLGLVGVAVSVGAAYTAQLKTAWWSIAIPMGVTLWLLGMNVTYAMVVRDIDSDRCARGTGRIRRYFIEQDPTLERYLLLQTDDAPMPWITKNQSVQREAVLVTAMVCGAAAVAGELDRRGWSDLNIVVLFLLTLAILRAIAHMAISRKLARAAEKARESQRFIPNKVE